MTAIELRVRSIYDSLSTAEKKVADYFLNNVESVFSLPIAQLAQEACVSKVTWVRFCKAIGFDGLKDLKKVLFAQMHKIADQNTSEPFSDVREVVNTKMLIEGIRQNSIQAISDTAAMLDPKSLEAAATTIVNAKTVRIFGVGASGIVGEDLHSKLMRINKHSYFSTDPHTQLTYAANMTAEDAAVLISMSGKTKEILEILALARQSRTPTIALTKYSKTPLALNADTTLYISAPEISKRSGAMSSRLAQLMVIDALFTATAHMDYDTIAVSLERSRESTNSHRIDTDEAYEFL
ncbi:MAG: MurR/RpiR family transcriptional regulator [Oscillospiraceae bacterium]|nr:MurR/RpiR family transcriptional regulator [Oscillospiraceae bacterium]